MSPIPVIRPLPLLSTLQRFALWWLALRAGAERADQLQFFPSVVVPPSQEGDRPDQLEEPQSSEPGPEPGEGRAI